MLIESAKKLLDWNSKNLIYSSNLKKSDLSDLFASQFRVVANGRQYEANYDNYFDFLNTFRETIKSIHYTVHDYIESKNAVTIPMLGHIERLDGLKQNYEAILILKFDKNAKIILWHEVYVEEHANK